MQGDVVDEGVEAAGNAPVHAPSRNIGYSSCFAIVLPLLDSQGQTISRSG
jgi:hypothetical protein